MLLGNEKGLESRLPCRYGESLGWTVMLKMLPQLQGHHSEIACESTVPGNGQFIRNPPPSTLAFFSIKQPLLKVSSKSTQISAFVVEKLENSNTQITPKIL